MIRKGEPTLLHLMKLLGFRITGSGWPMVRELQQPGRNKEHLDHLSYSSSHGSVGHGVLEDIRGLSLNGLFLFVFSSLWSNLQHAEKSRQSVEGGMIYQFNQGLIFGCCCCFSILGKLGVEMFFMPGFQRQYLNQHDPPTISLIKLWMHVEWD